MKIYDWNWMVLGDHGSMNNGDYEKKNTGTNNLKNTLLVLVDLQSNPLKMFIYRRWTYISELESFLLKLQPNFE